MDVVPSPQSGSSFVLIIEDNADGRETMGRLLRRLGHRVATAADGMEGVAQALELRPDIALVDLGLPLWDGFVVCERLRAALGGSIRLVAHTAYGDTESREQATIAGFDAFLVKPVAVDDLKAVLAGSIDQGTHASED
jgi:two-component system, sensor histidine kinase